MLLPAAAWTAIPAAAGLFRGQRHRRGRGSEIIRRRAGLSASPRQWRAADLSSVENRRQQWAPPRAGRMDRFARQLVDRARDGESNLALALRTRNRRDAWQFRKD